MIHESIDTTLILIMQRLIDNDELTKELEAALEHSTDDTDYRVVDGEEGDNGVIVSLDEPGNPTMYSINFGGDGYDFAVAAEAADKFKDIVRKHVLVKLEAALDDIKVIHGKH